MYFSKNFNHQTDGLFTIVMRDIGEAITPAIVQDIAASFDTKRKYITKFGNKYKMDVLMNGQTEDPDEILKSVGVFDKNSYDAITTYFGMTF